MDETNILPQLEERLRANWTSEEKSAEKVLGKIIYGDANIDLEALDENLNDSVDDALFENYMVKRNDFIYRKNLGNPIITSPSKILDNIKKKEHLDEMTKNIINQQGGGVNLKVKNLNIKNIKRNPKSVNLIVNQENLKEEKQGERNDNFIYIYHTFE
tara:strand:+ start:131 stop:604 length:474 start_codon:yes stop_codon:yes gene_type:complete